MSANVLDSWEETRSPFDCPFGVLAINSFGEFRLRWFKDHHEFEMRTAKSTFSLFGHAVFMSHFGVTGWAAVGSSLVNLMAYEVATEHDARELITWLGEKSLHAIAWTGGPRELCEDSTNVFLRACQDHISTRVDGRLTLELLKSRKAEVIHAINQLPKVKFFSAE